MAGPGSSSAIPVWLTEEDLNCIICQGLLTSPATLQCGHSFCCECLRRAWGARGTGVASHPWACPTCLEGAALPPKLRKNTLLQYLADKFSRAQNELEVGPERVPSPVQGPEHRPAQPRATVPENITEVVQKLTDLVGQLVDIVKRLQRQTPLSESGQDNEVNIALSSGEDRGLTSLNLETSNTSEGRMGEILHDLEEIQKNLQENVTWKAAPEEQTQGIINPTFDLGSLSCILKVSEDCRTVTVSQFRQPYPWSQERFSTSQVLCSQALSSGRHYWEVDTKCCNNWAVGVASWGMSRDRMLGRTADSWCIEWKGTGQLSAWTMVKETVLGSDRPGVVGIWLDLEERKLAFYSVASQEKLLYECEMAASSPLHPAFWLYGLTPGNSLIINQVRV
ncbi:E3 ubiquitin-protein ligase RNF135 isoform X1 [Marmota monax]|uniref:E3 ubiquitin-protein ligase RNF135 isoform X3 n=1 Tax=Marmota marmota marmota TaxID=9994 RepID=UPI000762BC3C|nr:E3 ubiquitin-protein ligase RNF135 isoform X3 [Marmota marmota marmota]XP_046282999.1 E3 ubiquitin-protein ligase RNF135 isoform X1 [Marmota monax]